VPPGTLDAVMAQTGTEKKKKTNSHNKQQAVVSSGRVLSITMAESSNN
jgi:hypothetical protein